MPSACLKLSLLYLTHAGWYGYEGQTSVVSTPATKLWKLLPLIQAFHFLCALPPNLHHSSRRLTFHLSVSQHCFKIQTFKKVRTPWVRGWVVLNSTGYTGSSDNSSGGFNQSPALADDPVFVHVHKENVRRKQSLRSSAILEKRFMQKSVSVRQTSKGHGGWYGWASAGKRKKRFGFILKQVDTSPWSVRWRCVKSNFRQLKASLFHFKHPGAKVLWLTVWVFKLKNSWQIEKLITSERNEERGQRTDVCVMGFNLSSDLQGFQRYTVISSAGLCSHPPAYSKSRLRIQEHETCWAGGRGHVDG